MSFCEKDELLIKRVEYLEYINRYSIDILEQALNLFDFNLRDQLKNNTYDRSRFLEDMESRIRKIIPVEDTAFFLVNEETFDFYLAYKNIYTDKSFIEGEVDKLIEDWAFSRALREKRALVVPSSRPGVKIILHVMSTSSRIRGMFFAAITEEKVNSLPDISLLLLSTTLLVCSNFLESIELYDILNKNNVLLEKRIQERTEQLEHQTYHDGLTSLPNRNFMIKKLKNMISLEPEKHFSFMKIDLNRFKEINDGFGHQTGDSALKLIAERLDDACRDEDIVGRFGGDEFAVIFPGIGVKREALKVSQSIIHKAELPFVLNGKNFQIDLSVGISFYPKDSMDLSGLIRKADVAMYKSKREKSGISLYNSKFDIDHSFDFFIKTDLKNALENNDIFPLFQPRYCFKEKRITGVEALSRWNHSSQGFIPPGKFIPLAEETGLIKRLTCYIVKRCLVQAKEWEKKGLDLKIGANLSALDLQDESFPEVIADMKKEFDVDPGRLEFEITESTIMTNPRQATENLKYLHELGFTLSIDDFGTGYSSLSYLHMFPVDNIKIDLSFVMDMDKKPENRQIVQTIIDLGKSLGKKTVAEGVETRNVALMLMDMGCDCIQGYYVGKAVTAAEIEDLMGKFRL